MKIKVKESSLEELEKMESYKSEHPKRQSLFFKKLVEVIAKGDMKKTNFEAEYIPNKDILNEPCFILMNHSSFIDLEMAFYLLKKRRFSIIATDDGFVGKKWLLEKLGCIPTMKFLNDTVLVRHMVYAAKKLNQSILMYPEASYTFDGTETPLPKSIGKCAKMLGLPVVIIKTDCGNFLRDPLYNNLQVRKANTFARIECVVSKEELQTLSPDEIQDRIKSKFAYNHFKEQYLRHIRVDEPFRADYLERILYKCESCLSEGTTKGSGTTLVCSSCSHEVTLSEYGKLENSKFEFIPDWYKWERENVKTEVHNREYYMNEEVEIYCLKNLDSIHHIGSGILEITANNYILSMKHNVIFTLSTKSQYSLYSDYYWYELGDMICIGDTKVRYYCIMKNPHAMVAKARLAQEEMYKLYNNN